MGFETLTEPKIKDIDKMDLDLATVYAKYLINPSADPTGRIGGMIAEIAIVHGLKRNGIVHTHNIPVHVDTDLPRYPQQIGDILLRSKSAPDMSIQVKCAGDNSDGIIRKYACLNEPKIETDFLIACKLLDPLKSGGRIAIIGYLERKDANKLIKWYRHLSRPNSDSYKRGSYGIPLFVKWYSFENLLFKIVKECQRWDYWGKI